MARVQKTHIDRGGFAACGHKHARQYVLPTNPDVENAVTCGRCRRTRLYKASVIDRDLAAEKAAREVEQQAALTTMLTRPVVFARNMLARATL